MANRKLTETQKQTVKYTRKELSLQSNFNTRWKVHWESTTPRESLSPTLSNTCHTYLFLGTPVHIPSVPTYFLEPQFTFRVSKGVIQWLGYDRSKKYKM